MLTEDKKLEILHDHYKDTFVHIKDYLKLRDKLLFLILLVITLMLFQIYSPQESGEAVSQLITGKLALQQPIDISFIGSILWFSLLAFVVRYFQTVVHIERQYKYIHELEEHLSSNYDSPAFTREGKSYLSGYPLFSTWTWILYTVIFPVLLLIVVFSKMYGEWCHAGDVTVLRYINTTIFFSLFISTVLYLLLIHFRK